MSDLYIFGYGPSGPSTIDISSATVTLGTSLTYNGTEQTQTVSVEMNGVTLTENTDYTITDNTATNAGSYILSILGTGTYSGTKTASWSIAKAQGSISIDPSSLTIVGANSTGTATITSVGDGAISAVSSNTSVATVSVSGNTMTVTSVASGSATVTVTMADGQNYLGSSATISISMIMISSTLSDNTPEQIKTAAQLGIASTLWSVGDKTAPITISVTTDLPNFTPPSEGVCAFIIGFDHNESIEGKGIHFQFGKTTGGVDVAFIDSGYGGLQRTSGTWFNMNNNRTNSGGWNGSSMKTTICPAFFNALPSAWQNVISTCTKYTDNTGGGGGDTASYVTATNDGKIWLLAEYEAFGTRSYANGAEQNYQKQYDYYASGNSKTKYRHSSTSSGCSWFLRSPRYDAAFFCIVGDGGNASYTNASFSSGFAPGFRVA